MHSSDPPPPVDCSNCGSTRGLLRCSRCRSAFFCSAKCQKVRGITESLCYVYPDKPSGGTANVLLSVQAYWPFHKPECRRNEFADATEASEPKFASWMRKHGKLAVLKDDEVDRLERASTATTGMHSATCRRGAMPS